MKQEEQKSEGSKEPTKPNPPLPTETNLGSPIGYGPLKTHAQDKRGESQGVLWAPAGQVRRPGKEDKRLTQGVGITVLLETTNQGRASGGHQGNQLGCGGGGT